MNATTEMMDFYVMLDESELRIALASIIDVWHKDKGKTAEEARQFTKSLAELQQGNLDISVKENKFTAIMTFDVAE